MLFLDKSVWFVNSMLQMVGFDVNGMEKNNYYWKISLIRYVLWKFVLLLYRD